MAKTGERYRAAVDRLVALAAAPAANHKEAIKAWDEFRSARTADIVYGLLLLLAAHNPYTVRIGQGISLAPNGSIDTAILEDLTDASHQLRDWCELQWRRAAEALPKLQHADLLSV